MISNLHSKPNTLDYFTAKEIEKSGNLLKVTHCFSLLPSLEEGRILRLLSAHSTCTHSATTQPTASLSPVLLPGPDLPAAFSQNLLLPAQWCPNLLERGMRRASSLLSFRWQALKRRRWTRC